MLVPLVCELNRPVREGGWLGVGVFMFLILELVLLFKMPFHSALFAESLEIHTC